MECAISYIRALRDLAKNQTEETKEKFYDALNDLAFEVTVFKKRPEYIDYIKALQWKTASYIGGGKRMIPNGSDLAEKLKEVVNWLEEEKDPAPPTTTKRQLLEEAHIKNGGRLTSDQVKKVALDNGFSPKSMTNAYRQMVPDLK